MGVVRVKQGRARPDLLQDRPEDARIEPHVPPDVAYPDALVFQAIAELAARTGHHHLVGMAGALQLAGEQQHLALPAAPLAAGRHMDDGLAHVSGSASTGWDPLSRRRT